MKDLNENIDCDRECLAIAKFALNLISMPLGPGSVDFYEIASIQTKTAREALRKIELVKIKYFPNKEAI